MWSPQQAGALTRVGQWLESKDKPFFMLAGYAGTGKTTLAKHLAASVKGRVYFASYTGKAAHVLSQSGAENVSTIHKLIYQPKDKSQKRLKELQLERAQLLTHKPVPTTMVKKVEQAIEMEMVNLSRPSFQLNSDSPLFDAALLVVDEYSMISQQMGEDIMSFGCPVLALGDPGQLPPVKGDPFFTGKPDVLLTEIHRQARDNPIIWMSQEVREGRILRAGDYGTSRVVSFDQLPVEELRHGVLSCNQLLVGRNTTRTSSNQRVRDLRGFGGEYPLEGDKLVCLKNNHDLGLLNGQIWTARENAIFDGDYLNLEIVGEDGTTLGVSAHPEHFLGTRPDYWNAKNAEEFDYGYALTVHKSQGSQWPNVLLFDEWHGRERKQWLYTAITRASERIDVVMM